MGRSLNASNIKEGDDVYFECLIQANPASSHIRWSRDVRSLHLCIIQLDILDIFALQGQPLHYSIEEGVIISNQSLVLQRVTKSESGHYQCQAVNSQGKGNSNTVNLPIKCEQ